VPAQAEQGGGVERAPTAAAVAVAVADLAASAPTSQDQGGSSPGPLAAAWAAYNAALATHPVLVKSATSFIGFLVGDLLAQAIVGAPYDAHRTLRLVLFGMLMDGPIGANRIGGLSAWGFGTAGLPAARCSLCARGRAGERDGESA